jgi:hypothetical protein
MPVPSKGPSSSSAESAAAGDLSALIRYASPSRTGSAAALPIAPNYPFFLMHWPTDWQVESEGLDGPTWLPGLSRHIILPGCNLNRTLRRGERPEAAYDMAVLQNVRRGATYIDVERHRLQSGGRYLREADCRNTRNGAEGVYYLDAWSTPRDAVPGRRLRFKFDRAGWNQYRLHLVESGVIRPPSGQVLDEIVNRKRRRLGRVQAHTNLEAGEYERRLDKASAVVELFSGASVPQPLAGSAPMMPSSPGRVPNADEAEVA